jgi:SAM-dependent methyltransferase
VINSQKAHWNDIHQQGSMDTYRSEPSEFVRSVTSEIEPHSTVLELGCGTGGDARFLADLGHKVVATDFSDVVIAENAKHYSDIDFRTVDTSEGLPFPDDSFGVVFANLSLHYFDDQVTHAVFAEIHRVLGGNGKLIFRCKSIYSDQEKQGSEEVGSDIYLLRGHLGHLFCSE